MPARANADIIRIVTKWQQAGFIHELTCRADALHAALVPVECGDQVLLKCPTCGELHEVPAVVLGSEALIDYAMESAKRLALARERRSVRRDVWFSVVVIMCCLTILPGLVWGATAASIGGAVGAGISVFRARRAFRKLEPPAPPDGASSP